MVRWSRPVSALALLAALALGGTLHAADSAQPLTIALPATSELDKLAELTAQFTGVSIQYNPQKIKGTVRLAVRGQLAKAELWAVFNQVLTSQGFTTVITGLPAVYQVVAMTEAPGLSAVLSAEDAAKLPYPPGFAVELIELRYLGAEATVKAVGALFSNQIAQVRTLGPEHNKLVIAAPQAVILEVRQTLERLDRPGVVPVVRLFRPQRTAPQTIQTSATAAWAAVSRVGSIPRLAEVQVAPDGAQLVLIANGEVIEQLETLVRDLDNAEPVEIRTYRPKFFGIDEVASLLQRLLKTEGSSTLPQGGVDIVRDPLTSSLVIKATAAQHKRIEDVLKTLDEAPANARRQIRSLPVKHRQADEVAKLISGLLGGTSPTTKSGSTSASAEGAGSSGGDSGGLAVSPRPASPLGGAQTAGGPMSTPGAGLRSGPGGGSTQVQGNAGGQGGEFVLSADVVTNRLIVMGDPRVLDQVQALLEQLDQRQPQVELEIILVTLSSGENLDLGIELVQMIKADQVSGGVGSLFGLSKAGTTPTDRNFNPERSGLGGIVMQPGDFAGVFTALEKVTSARSIIRSRVVVNNNAKSTIDGVVQQPVTSNNSTNTVSTTSVTGTTDAGTQISITPQISIADYVTLTYTISQSTFLGEPTINNGSVIPPPKRADNVTSVATVPDGFVIGLGGLSNRSDTHGESRLPWLGRIPWIGNLFKSSTDATSDSRFFVFIRTNVLRNESFNDLRHLGDQHARSVEFQDAESPRLKPEVME